MTHELDNILISYDQPKFQEKLFNIYLSKAGMSHFGLGPKHTKNRQKVEAILRDVIENGDEAVIKYTKEFDDVNKLTPEQFRVNQNDLKKAHEQIAPELLGSIRKSIKNVKSYQKETIIVSKKHIVVVQSSRSTPSLKSSQRSLNCCLESTV